MGRLDGKVALISGSARGQGEAEARLFVAEGARVVVSDVLDDLGSAVAADLGDAAAYVHLDVRDESDWVAGVASTLDRFGRLDVLVNNAGIVMMAPLAETTRDDFMEVIRINQVGCFLGMRTAAPHLADGGAIVNISSINGMGGGPQAIAYAASKFAIRGMTKTAAMELGPRVRVNSVHPGGILTEMSRGALETLGSDPFVSVPLGRIGRVDEVAEMVCFLASDEASYVTGSDFIIDGGWYAGPALS